MARSRKDTSGGQGDEAPPEQPGNSRLVRRSVPIGELIDIPGIEVEPLSTVADA